MHSYVTAALTLNCQQFFECSKSLYNEHCVIFTFLSTARAIIEYFRFAGYLCSKLVPGVTGSQSIMEI